MGSKLIRRRAELQKKLDEYEGCEFGYISSVSAWVGVWGVTPVVEIPSNCTSLTFAHFNVYGEYKPVLACYKDGVMTDYWAENANPRTVNIRAAKFDSCRLCLNIDEIDNCYIKDNTNGVYLWKGKNVKL